MSNRTLLGERVGDLSDLRKELFLGDLVGILDLSLEFIDLLPKAIKACCDFKVAAAEAAVTKEEIASSWNRVEADITGALTKALRETSG